MNPLYSYLYMYFHKLHKIATWLTIISSIGTVTCFFLSQLNSIWRGQFMSYDSSLYHVMDTLLWAFFALALGSGWISFILSQYHRSEKQSL